MQKYYIVYTAFLERNGALVSAQTNCTELEADNKMNTYKDIIAAAEYICNKTNERMKTNADAKGMKCGKVIITDWKLLKK